MIVEDEPEVARTICKILERSGYSVPAVASSGVEAIEMATEIRPDLVLIDVSLNGSMDGVDAAVHIRRQLGLPVIYLAGQADDATLHRAKRARPSGYLLKPVRALELHSTIMMALHNAQIPTDEQEQESVQGGDMTEHGNAAEGLWRAAVNYFERWTAYDRAVQTANADDCSLEEAEQRLVLLAGNELRHSTGVFREAIVRAGGLADGVPQAAYEMLCASEQYFHEMAARDHLTLEFQQHNTRLADVERACTRVTFAQGRMREAAITFRDSVHLSTWATE